MKLKALFAVLGLAAGGLGTPMVATAAASNVVVSKVVTVAAANGNAVASPRPPRVPPPRPPRTPPSRR